MSLKFPVSLVGKRIASWLGFGSASRELDGDEDYINLGDILDGVFAGVGKKFTVAAWIKYVKPTGGAGRSIISKDDVGESGTGRQWNFSVFDDGVNTDGAIRVVISNGANTKRRAFDTDSGYINGGTVWNHVAFTYDQTKDDDELVTIYVNGEPAATSITAPAGSDLVIEDTASPVVIGFFDIVAPSTWYGKGNIADVRIYDTDIGPTNVLNISQGQYIQNNLVGHWLKDTDDFIDHSINSNTGCNGFEPCFSTDAPPVSYTSSGDASRDFNGVDDMVTIADDNIYSFGGGSSDDPFSIAAWIKMDNSDRFRILSKHQASREFLFTTTSTKNLVLALYDDNAVGGTASQQRRYTAQSMDNYLGSWTHVAATYDGRGGSTAHEGIKLYIDGSEVATVETNANGANYVAIENTSSDVTIGGEDLGARRADGKIADVRLYDDELTSSEVTSIYNGTDHTGNLIGHWLGNTDDFNDMSVNSGNGTVDGSTYSLDGPKP